MTRALFCAIRKTYKNGATDNLFSLISYSVGDKETSFSKGRTSKVMYMNEKLVPEAMVLSKKIELATRFKLYHEKYASENFQVMNYGIGGKISGHADSQGETVEKSVEVEGRPGKLHSYTVGEKKDSTKRYLWSKTTLITAGVGGAGVEHIFS